MNLDKFEKIDGREVLKRLLEGNVLYGLAGMEYKLSDEGQLLFFNYMNDEWEQSEMGFNKIINYGLYIPKPFDVRQAMLDRPNEWVGAFEFSDSWYKVGFDSNYMVAIETGFKNDVPVMYHNEFNDSVEALLLNICIPIEDVPEEATR